MKVVVLSSSSKGNSTYIEMNNSKFLIDAGLGFNDIKDKLFEIGVTADELDFIMVTHAHSDHVRSIHSFNRVYNTKIYIGEETYNEYNKKELLKNYEFLDNITEINGIKFDKIPISHDKSGFGFIFEHNNKSICYMADTGMIHTKFHKKMQNKTIYVFESNHDVMMEMNGTKDEMTKIRNIGDMGHLSNEDCAMYLNRLIGNDTTDIILIHISEHDNLPEKAYEVNRTSIIDDIKIHMSYPDKMSEIIEI
jgi:phosphoribosyl 1,2-cyclic phosphodiesterase